MARPTKLTAKRTTAICESIARGTSEEAAAEANGIHPATLYRWKERGEAALDAEADGQTLSAQDELAARFCEGVTRARGECEDRLVQVVSHAALGRPAEYDAKGKLKRAEVKPDPVHATVLLERKWPQRWARRLHVRDETPRSPAPVNPLSVAGFEAAFAASFGDQLPEIDATNLMPAIAFGDEEDDADTSTNGHRNGHRNGSGS